MAGTFVHLHTHSEYSILDSSCKIPALLERAASCGMDALALTDHGMMSGVIKLYREAKKRGIKPIIGAEIYLAPGDRHERRAHLGKKYFHLVLLAADREGYQNLLAIVSRSHTEGFYYKPRADKDLLRRYHAGLIALSACESGELSRLLSAGHERQAQAAAQEYAEIFGEGNFYIELQDHGTQRGRLLQEQLVQLAQSLDLPLVATNDIHYLHPEDRLAHEALLNIRANKKLSDPDRRTFDGEGYHFRTHEEMVELFAQFPQAIENTRVIAERCNLELELGATMIPPFELPPGVETPDVHLRTLAYDGAKGRFGTLSDEVKERLDRELAVIERMNYATYFLIVWDFVRFARESNIPVGPGRGSASGSLVSYCLGITGVDPLKYNLIFERFLNPDRISMPDFDIDFCAKGRDRVIEYVREKYDVPGGPRRTAQIATFDRMAARSVVRDVGRVLGVPYGKTDRLAKLIPYGYQLRTAIEKVAELKTLYKTDDEVRKLVDIGCRLEGLTRNASTHAAGVVISTDELIRHVPLMRLKDGEVVTQFDMGDVEAVGLLKFDFLGLRNLTLVDETCSNLRKRAGIDIDVDNIPLDDEKTFALIQQGHTAGIFQLESSGMKGLIERVLPNRFEDLIALLALYRPGPLESGMTDDYVARRSGRKPVTYPHPDLKEVLEDTYGLPIYQDQIMLIAQKLAGFSLAEADILRKAMGKKKKDIMDSLHEKFIAGCRANEIPQELAVQTFQDMEKFARYGFNKAHATAYAFVSYWTAYLKANHPTQFMAGLLASVQGDLDKVAEYIGDCREMGIEVLPPDINESERDFAPVDEGRIRFGLGAIKHVGGGTIEAILAARGNGFASFFDLCRHIDGEGGDREALEALIKAGAFDSLGASRRDLLLRLAEGLELMQVASRERRSGQQSFFEGFELTTPEPAASQEEFPQADLLRFEKELLGLYVSAHPLDSHRATLAHYCTPLSQASAIDVERSATIGGRVKKIRRIVTRNGDQMAFVSLEDGTAELEVTIFPRVLDGASELLVEDQLLGCLITASDRNGARNFVVEEVFPLEKLATRTPLSVTLTVQGKQLDPEWIESLSSVLQQHPGEAPVLFHVEDEGAYVDVIAGKGFSVFPSLALKEGLEVLLGEGRVRFRNGV